MPSATPTVVLLLALFTFLHHRVNASDDCARTSKMRIYSSAFIHKETGDLLGYDLALGPANESSIDALLFIHEGSPGEGIPLKAKQSDGKVTIEGDWIEHLLEYPSKKETVQTRSVKISGTADRNRFTGKIAIEGVATSERLSLKRVRKIWMCRGK